MNYAQLPAECPGCGQVLFRLHNRPRAVMQNTARSLFVISGAATIVWSLGLIAYSPIMVIPRSIGGMAVVAAIFLFPGLVLGGIAGFMRKVVHLRCPKCGWRESILLDH